MGYIIKDFKKSDIIPDGSIYMETISKSIKFNNEVILESFFRFLIPFVDKKSIKKIKKIKK